MCRLNSDVRLVAKSSSGPDENGDQTPPHLDLQKTSNVGESDIKLIEEFENGEKVELKSIRGLVPDSFKRNALDYPNETAISFNGKQTTYHELDRMALQIAGYLKRTLSKESLKAKPIILFMEKSEMMIAAVLGIWKACGYFLPVSLTSKSTLKETVKQTGAEMVITNLQKQCDTLGLSDNAKVIQITDILKETIECFEKESFDCVKESDIAYVIKTSGSTGKPKQCRVSHKSLSVIASAWLTKYKLDEFPVKVLQWAQFSFDVFIGDLVRGLVCAPGMLCLCPDDLRLDIPHLIELIKTHGITITELTPQFGKQLVESARNGALSSLRVLILGSDVLQSQTYTQIKSSLQADQRLINSYGMTEATIDSSCFEGDTVPETQSCTVPIGKPFPGITLHVLDTKTLTRCRVGEVGELYISGPVIATGDVVVTKIDGEVSALKTGDAARRLPCGNVELIGRLDNMLKIRGYRISSSEIENAIMEHVDGVQCALVTTEASKTNGDNALLFAYIVPEANRMRYAITNAYVRRCLRDKLPSYMIPDHVHTIDKIPLTPNGKTDRNGLAEVVRAQNEYKSTGNDVYKHTDMLSGTCEEIGDMFKEALSLDSNTAIDPSIPFMEQGGSSLVLVRLSSLIQDRTSFKIRIADIYSHPTVLALAAFVDGNQNHRGLPVA